MARLAIHVLGNSAPCGAPTKFVDGFHIPWSTQVAERDCLPQSNYRGSHTLGRNTFRFQTLRSLELFSVSKHLYGDSHFENLPIFPRVTAFHKACVSLMTQAK